MKMDADKGHWNHLIAVVGALFSLIKGKKMRWKVGLIILVCTLLMLTSCDAISSVSNSPVSLVKAEVANIQFSTNPKATHVVFDIEVTPRGAKADTTYYVCLLSRDGYYFEHQSNPVRWTEAELQGPDKNERDYSKIKQAEERKIKRFTLGASLNDKDIVALNEDCKLEAERITEKYARELQSALQAGDLVELFKRAGKSPELSRSEINKLFNRHLKLVVTDKEGYLKILYPDGEIVKLGEFSGQGSFKTPNFTPKYKWLRITILSPNGGRGEGGLYYSDGKGSQWGTCNIQSDNEGKPFRLPVQPGKEYYYTFTIPDDTIWKLIIEESNMGIWIEEMK